MKVDIKKLEKSQIELKFKLSKEELNSFVDKATKSLGKDLEIKGFRKGQAPNYIIQAEIGMERILASAAERAIKEKYLQAVKENNLEPISQPKAEILKLAPGNEFEFKLTVAVLPEVKLPDYKKAASQVVRREASISEKEIEDALKWLQKSRAKFTLLDRPAQKGDFIEIEYRSPQINSSKKIKDGFVLGEGHFIPGFEEKLIGMKKDEEREFSLTFPEKFKRKDLAGKKADFKVKMIGVKKMEIPEINDSFAKELGGFESLKKLKENIKEGLQQEKHMAEKQRQRSEVLQRIAEDTKMEIPETLIATKKKRLLSNLKQNISQNLQISFEDYLATVKKSEKELEESFAAEAEKRIKSFLILKEIGKQENIQVTEEEIEQGANEALKQYSPEMKKKIDLEVLKGYTKEAIYNEKVFQKLESFIKN